MPIYLQKYLAFLLAIALIIALIAWMQSSDQPNDLSNQGTPETLVDFFMINPHTQQFREDGRLHYQITANKLEHLQATDITLLDTPNMEIYNPQKAPWHIQSKRAEISPKGTTVELIEKVIVHQQVINQPTRTLTTSRLTVFPEEEYAQTDQFVTLKGDGTVTTANGMKAYLKEGKLLLLSNVRGEHAPH